MLVGHGIDVVEIDDLKRWIDDPRDPFLSRCFSDAELSLLDQGAKKYEAVAGRFAAKEAVLKAIGTGFGDGVSFKDVEVTRRVGQPPHVELSGGALKAAEALGVRNWLLSISYTRTFAFASAIAST